MKRSVWIPALTVCCLSSISYADTITLRGFGSIVGGQTGGADELHEGYDNHFDLRPNSLMALQFDADLENNLRATVQLIGKGANDYETQVEWAYVTYEFSDAFQLSGGKIRIPFYRYSDYQDVRYTYNWVEAPREVYGFDFSSLDGLSLLNTTSFGGWDSSLQFIFGQHDGLISGSQGSIEDLVGLTWSLNRDWLTLRAGYFQSNLSMEIAELDQLAGAVDGIGAGFGVDLSNVTEGIVVNNDDASFFGFAMGIDYNNFLLDTEYVEYDIESTFIPKSKGYYVSLGYRFDKVTPFVIKSFQKAEVEDDTSTRVPNSIASFPVIPAGGGMITLPQFLTGAAAAAETDDESLEIGIRYDFHPSAALKASYMYREDIAGEEINLFRTGIDFVF